MEAENIGLSDEEFWSNPLKDDDESIPPDGLYLGAPGSVALGSRHTLPLLVRRSVSLKDSIAVLFKRYALVHGIDVQSNRVFANYAVEQDNAVYEDRDPAVLARVKGRTLQPFLIDARERLDLPWRPSTMLFTVTVRDRVSNRRLVTLGRGAGAYEDPAVQEYLEKNRKVPVPTVWPQPAHPPEVVPAYVNVDGSPQLPNQPGIAISGDRVTELRKGARCVVRGSFLVPIGKDDLVPAEEGERHTAVVGIHLVLVGADDPMPMVRTLRVPVYGEATPGQLASGFFTVDLLQLYTPPSQTQTYFLYLFSREVMSGPQPFAFVGRDLLGSGSP
jgi:hypothetical protein